MFTIHRLPDPAVEEDGTTIGEEGFEGGNRKAPRRNEKVEDQTVATDDCSGCIGW